MNSKHKTGVFVDKRFGGRNVSVMYGVCLPCAGDQSATSFHASAWLLLVLNVYSSQASFDNRLAWSPLFLIMTPFYNYATLPENATWNMQGMGILTSDW